jgi:SAM-dependent methyltransferase
MIFDSNQDILHENIKLWKELKIELIPSTIKIPNNILENYYYKSETILDIGCGTGETFKILDNHKFKKLVGYDLNDNAILKAKQIKYKNDILFYNSDELLLKNYKEQFDLINMKALLSCIYGIKERINLLQNLKKNLIKDGKLVIIDFLQNSENDIYSKRYSQYKELTKEYGTFRVNNNDSNGVLYYSHHFSFKELEFILNYCEFKIDSYEENIFYTRSGNKITGFILIASNIKKGN